MMTRTSAILFIGIASIGISSQPLLADEIPSVATENAPPASTPVPVAPEPEPDDATVQIETDVMMETSADLESLVSIAVSNSPAIQQALAEIDKARGLRYQSTRSPNPVAGYMASEVGNDRRAGQQGAFWAQNFRVAEKLDLNQQIGNWDVQAAVWMWQAEQKRVRGLVQLQWYETAAAEQRVKLLNKLQTVLNGGVQTAQSLFEAGEASRSPLLQAQLELQRNALEIRNAESNFSAHQKQLAAVATVTVHQLPGEYSGLTQSQTVSDEQAYVSTLLASSPELQQLRTRVSQNQCNVRRQQVEPIPDLQTQFSVQYDDSTHYTVTGIQVGVALPLFDQNRGNISAANAEFVRACQQVRQKELELTRRAASAYRDYIVASRAVQTIDSELLPLAQDNLKTAVQSFKQGENTYQSLLTAQRTFVELILSRIDALREVRQAETVIHSWLLVEDVSGN